MEAICHPFDPFRLSILTLGPTCSAHFRRSRPLYALAYSALYTSTIATLSASQHIVSARLHLALSVFRPLQPPRPAWPLVAHRCKPQHCACIDGRPWFRCAALCSIASYALCSSLALLRFALLYRRRSDCGDRLRCLLIGCLFSMRRMHLTVLCVSHFAPLPQRGFAPWDTFFAWLHRALHALNVSPPPSFRRYPLASPIPFAPIPNL